MYNIKKNIDRLRHGKPTFFLDPSEEKKVSSKFKKQEYNVFKPYPDCEKVILYKDKLPEVILLKIVSNQEFRHQDILGSIFNLNVDKEIFGDIIYYNNCYYFYLLKTMKDYFLTNLIKIKNSYISLEEVDINYLANYQKAYQTIELIVKSERIDLIISNITSLSRSKIKEKFQNKEIILNYNILTNPSYLLKENDIFSIRKYGKFKYLGKINKTKKDNYLIKINKYCN